MPTRCLAYKPIGQVPGTVFFCKVTLIISRPNCDARIHGYILSLALMSPRRYHAAIVDISTAQIFRFYRFFFCIHMSRHQLLSLNLKVLFSIIYTILFFNIFISIHLQNLKNFLIQTMFYSISALPNFPYYPYRGSLPYPNLFRTYPTMRGSSRSRGPSIQRSSP